MVKLFVSLLLLAAAVLAGAWLFTPQAAEQTLRFFLTPKYVQPENLKIGRVRGNLANGAWFEDVELKNIQGLPDGSVLRAKSVQLRLLSGIEIDDLEAAGIPPSECVVQIQKLILTPPYGRNVRWQNGRIHLPHSDPVLFYGSWTSRGPDIQVYARKVDVADILKFFPEIKAFRRVTGAAEEIHLFITGEARRPIFRGNLNAAKISYNKFSLSDARAAFSLRPQAESGKISLLGKVLVKGGTLSARKSNARIDLLSSVLLFKGDPSLPTFDLRGRSLVEDAEISIELRGTTDKPELTLTSDPPMSREQLLIMLATGRGWAGTREALQEGRVSVDIAKEFIDYFVLGGSGTRLAQALGIRDISLEYTEEMRGVEVKKDLLPNVDAIYGVEQSRFTPTSYTPLTNKVGAEYRFNRESGR